MSVDREQIRRDAELTGHATTHEAGHLTARRHAKTILALLTELEQAEEDRDDWKERAVLTHAEYSQQTSRFAKVPALVEALNEACDWLDPEMGDSPPTETIEEVDGELVAVWRAALAAWEQE